MENRITNFSITDSDRFSEVESVRFAGDIHSGGQAQNSDLEMAYAEEQAREYEETQALIDLDIEGGLMRQLFWYRYD